MQTSQNTVIYDGLSTFSLFAFFLANFHKKWKHTLKMGPGTLPEPPELAKIDPNIAKISKKNSFLGYQILRQISKLFYGTKISKKRGPAAPGPRTTRRAGATGKGREGVILSILDTWILRLRVYTPWGQRPRRIPLIPSILFIFP